MDFDPFGWRLGLSLQAAAPRASAGRAIFDKADLRGADMRKGSAQEASFKDADLRNIKGIKDITRAMAVASRIESGICHINGPTVHDEAQMPFGGVKASGYGRFGGKAGIAEFTELRWITVQGAEHIHYPI